MSALAQQAQGEAARPDLFAERRVGDLASGAQFFLWCFRTNVAGLTAGISVGPKLRNGFAMAEIPRAASHFAAFFDTLSRHAHRTLSVGCCKCQRVSSDEALLLTVVARLQDGDTEFAESLLQDVLPGRVIPEAGRAAADLAAAMAAVELRVDRPGGLRVIRRFSARRGAVPTHPGSQLIN